MLSGRNILLTPVLVGKLSELSPENLEIALQNAAEGLHPWARPVPADTPEDLVRWDYHLDCLREAGNLLTEEDAMQPALSLTVDEKRVIHWDATATRVAISALLLALQAFGDSNRLPVRRRSTLGQGVPPLETMKRIRGVAERVTHDVPLVLSQHAASPQALQALRSAATDLHARANWIAEHTLPGGAGAPAPPASLLRDQREEPDARPGTYVVIVHSDEPAVRRIGRLESFWLPAGYYLYVGSSCGSGGVRTRTTRHGCSNACRHWNVDYIKAIAQPVEIWWTHHPKDKKVECPWAMALAELPGYFCPTPRFGGNDCKRCPAHLYHTLQRPSCEAFAALVQRQIPDHEPIYRHCFN